MHIHNSVAKQNDMPAKVRDVVCDEDSSRRVQRNSSLVQA